MMARAVTRVAGFVAWMTVMTGIAAAQSPTATMRGRVINRSLNAPVANAEIVRAGDNRSVRSDSLGRYVFGNLPQGVSTFLVRALPYPPMQLIVELKSGEELERTIELDSTASGRGAQVLSTVAVPGASVNRRLIDFERRRQTGRGHYLTREAIEQSGASSVQEAVRNLRGVTVDCGGGLGCYVRMARAPMQCKPDYIVDDRVNNSFGPTTSIRDIEAMEVYTGPSDVPGEYAGSTAACGVIVIWTRSGPPARRR
jgi:hypothetical protein